MVRSVLKAFVAASALTSFVAAQHQSSGGGTEKHSSVSDDKMGPAAFMWPPDRVWSGDMDNVPPCGSRASAGNRTNFPLVGGAVSLVGQDDYYNSRISISYKSDPTTNEDFTVLVENPSISDLNPGHTCAKIPDAPSHITAGTNATLQIIYKADWDAPHNQTFYACADITYVSAADFKTRIPCFNATEPGEDDKKWAAAASSAAAASPSSTSSSSNSGSSSSGGKTGLSGGAIAGIVVGVVGGIALLIVGGFFFYRRRQQAATKARLARMEDNARKHDWTGTDAASRNSRNSVQLKNLP